MRLPPFDTNRIRAAVLIPDLLQRRGWPLRKTSDGWRGACPIHQGDRNDSFHVVPDGQRWQCFSGCGTGGDVIALVQALDGLGFPEACAALGGKSESLGSLCSTEHRRPRALAPEPMPDLDCAKREQIAAIANRLSDDDRLTAALAASRGEDWEPVTLRALAYTNALGWLDHCPGADGGLAFLYPHAIKVRGLWRDDRTWRWHRPDGSKQVSWLWKAWPWNGAELWREDKLRLLLRTRAFLTEGEPDAIVLIDAGTNDHETTVVALPCADPGSKLVTRLPSLLADLHVAFFADKDSAGQEALTELAPVIRTTAASFHPVDIDHLLPPAT